MVTDEIAGCSIEGVLATSERATVYRGSSAGRPVAVKVRTAPSAPSQHAPIPASTLAHGVLRERHDDAGRRVTVMPLMPGHALVDELQERAAIDTARIHHVIERLFAILDRGAHPAVRTDNLFITPSGSRPDVSLFGADTPRSVRPPLDAYAAPELRDSPVATIRVPLSIATNRYAIGVILYELLTGVVPWQSPTEAIATRESAIAKLHVLRPGLHAFVAQTIDALTSVDPSSRRGFDAYRLHLSTLIRMPIVPSAAFDQELVPIPARKPAFAPTDVKEQTLVDALRTDPTDRATRQVYADWLEQHGFDLRAQHLRIEDRLADTTTSMRDVGMSSPTEDLAWRTVTSRAPISKCTSVSFSFACPKRWDALQPTRFDNVRFCSACEKPVYMVGSVDEAYAYGARNECIAIDAAVATGAALERYERGAQPVSRPMMMGAVAPMPLPTSNPPAPRPPALPGDEKKGVMTKLFGWFKK